MKKFICVVMVIFIHLPVYCQVLKGHIVDVENKSIEYVNIGIVGTNKGIISDEKGYFSIDISQQKQMDSIYFYHLSYKRKSIAIKDFYNKTVILEQNYIEIPEVEIYAQKPKIKIIKGKGTRFAGSTISYTKKNIENHNFYESIGNIIHFKDEHIAKEFNISCIKNTSKKAIFRLNFHKIEGNNFIPLSKRPIYIEIPQTDKRIMITDAINVSLPKGKIWIELVLVDLEGDDQTEIVFPVSFSSGWSRTGENLEKLPLGVGISFSIKGYQKE